MLRDRLSVIQSVRFDAQSALATGWNGSGQGEVRVETPSPSVILFNESGSWTPQIEPHQESHPVRFRNTFRWTFEADGSILHLEHLRFGPDHPVYLFDLAPSSPVRWMTLNPHHCGADAYQATLLVMPIRSSLTGTLQGPKRKSTCIMCMHSSLT